MTLDIELKHVRNRKRFWTEVTRAVPVPDYFGNNLDAFYDVLSETGEDTEIVFHHTEKCRKYLGAYLDRLAQMCADVRQENPRVRIRFEE